MVSCGYEPSAVMDGFGSLRGFWGMVRGSFMSYRDPDSLKLLNGAALGEPAALVAAGSHDGVPEETGAWPTKR